MNEKYINIAVVLIVLSLVITMPVLIPVAVICECGLKVFTGKFTWE